MTATVVLVGHSYGGAAITDAIEFNEDGTIVVDPARAGDIFYPDCEPAAVETYVSMLVPEGAADFAQLPSAVAWRERPSTYVARASRPELVSELLLTLARTVEP